tara:strand:+ start:503 stop:814 length:312 start_codon:yes stop_codon:yes gene_type:complete
MSETTGLDHQAIRKAYPNVTFIDDEGSKIKDAEGKDVAVEQSQIDAARVELNKLNYKFERQYEYPPIEDFADAMYWNSKGDSSLLTAYYAACEKVKTNYPKPS